VTQVRLDGRKLEAGNVIGRLVMSSDVATE
jgi:hypothetical protein